jgi:drug/metabolite transporter (DMT)-like permease
MTKAAHKPSAYLWMVCAMFAFATMGALSHGLREDVSWEIIALARSVIILAASGMLAALGGVKLRIWQPAMLWLRSLLGTISMLCVFFSFTRLPIAIVITLLNLAPVWVALLSWPLLRQAVGKDVWVAIFIGLAGVVLIQQPELAQGNFAILVPLAASLVVAGVLISLHRLRDVDHRAVVFHFALVSLLVCTAAAALSGIHTAPSMPENPVAWCMLLGVGLMSTTGQLFLTAAFASGPPARLSVIGLSQVGFAMLYDVLIWGHRFDITALTGIALVVAPTAWLLVRNRRVLANRWAMDEP